MSPVSAVAIYFIVWWLVFFAVLPFGVHNQSDEGEFVLGSERGAPARLALGRKILITSLIAAAIFAVIFVAFVFFDFGLDDLIV